MKKKEKISSEKLHTDKGFYRGGRKGSLKKTSSLTQKPHKPGGKRGGRRKEFGTIHEYKNVLPELHIRAKYLGAVSMEISGVTGAAADASVRILTEKYRSNGRY